MKFLLALLLVLCAASRAMAAITLVGTTNASNSTPAASIIINYPAGRAQAQVAYTYVVLNGTASVTSPGWTTVRASSLGPSLFIFILRRLTTGSESPTVTLTASGGGLISMANMRLYAGVNVTAMEDISVSNPVYAFGNTGQPTSGSTFTTNQNGETIVAFATDRDRCASLTAPTGFGNASTACNGTAQSTGSWDMPQGTAGNIGTVTAGGVLAGDTWNISVLALQPAPPPPTTINFVGGTYKSQSAATAITLAYPAGTAANNVGYAFIQLSTPDTYTGFTAAGWTQVYVDDPNSANGTLVLQRVFNGTESGSATFTIAGSTSQAAQMRVYSGVSTTQPVDILYQNPFSDAENVGQPNVYPGYETAKSDLLVAFADDVTSNVTLTAPAGYGNAVIDSTNSSAGVSSGSWDLRQSTAAVPGNVTSGGVVAGHLWGMVLVALQAAPGTINYVGGSTANQTGASSITLNYPAGTAANDVAVAYFMVKPGTYTSGANIPSLCATAQGWDETRFGSGGGGYAFGICQMIRVLNGSEGPSVTFNIGPIIPGNLFYTGTMRVYRGLDPVNPIPWDADLLAGMTDHNAIIAYGHWTQPEILAASQNTFGSASPGSILLEWVADATTKATLTTPSGFGNALLDNASANSQSQASWDKPLPTAGTMIGDVISGGATTNDNWMMWQDDLQPAGITAPVPTPTPSATPTSTPVAHAAYGQLVMR